MAVVPLSRGPQVRLNPLPNESIRVTDTQPVGQAIGQGLQQLGQAGGEFAENEQRLYEIRAEEEARRLDTEHMQGIRSYRERVRGSRGIAAREAATSAEQELRQFNGEFIARASNPLARRMLQESITRRSVQEVDSWAGHAATEEARAIDAGHEARASSLIEEALDHAEEPEIASQRVEAAVQEVRQRGAFNGWDEATTQQQVLSVRSAFHVGRARQRFEADDPVGARDILDLHGDEILAADEAQMRRMISGDLQANEADADAAFVLNGTPSPAEAGEPAAAAPSAATGRVVEGNQAAANFRARVRGAESSGNDNAQNARSSASGRYQFTDATFNSYFRRVYGRAPRAGERNDPAVQERLMTALTADNQTALRRAGQPATEGNLYLLHFAGEAGGTALLRAAPNTPASQIFGSAVMQANPHLRGMTASDVVAWAHRRMGAPAPDANAGSLPAPDGSRIDVAGAYARIEAQPWTESRKRRAREAVNRFAGQNDQVRGRIEQDALRELNTTLDQMARTGERLTSLSQLPSAALQNAPPGTIDNLRASIDANNRAAAPEANSPLMAQMVVMAAEDPNRFVREVNPEHFRGRVTDAEVEQLHRTRTEITQRRGAQPSQINRMVNMVIQLPNPGNDQELRQRQIRERGRLITAVQERLRRTRGAEPVNEDDILRAVRAETTLVRPTMGPHAGEQVPLYEAQRTGNVGIVEFPTEATPMLDRILRSRGLPLTNRNRAALYIDNREEIDSAVGR